MLLQPVATDNSAARHSALSEHDGCLACADDHNQEQLAVEIETVAAERLVTAAQAAAACMAVLLQPAAGVAAWDGTADSTHTAAHTAVAASGSQWMPQVAVIAASAGSNVVLQKTLSRVLLWQLATVVLPAASVYLPLEL